MSSERPPPCRRDNQPSKVYTDCLQTLARLTTPAAELCPERFSGPRRAVRRLERGASLQERVVAASLTEGPEHDGRRFCHLILKLGEADVIRPAVRPSTGRELRQERADAMFAPFKVGGFIAAKRNTGMAADVSRRSLSAAVAAIKVGPSVCREAERVARSWASGPASDGQTAVECCWWNSDVASLQPPRR